jgi:hypothetical protein
MTSPALLPVHTLVAQIAARRLSPVDVLEDFLTRIDRLDGKLHAFVSVNATKARLAAEAADKAIRSGHAVGPLHGIPIAIKDLVEIEGEIAMGGTAAWRSRIAPHTATLMRKLMAAGMVNLGKTHTVEFAYGGWGTNQHLGTPWNPCDAGHASGAGRLLLRFRRGRCRSHGTLGHRYRYGRVGPASGGVKRRHRPENDNRPDQHLRRIAAQPDPGHSRADHPRRRGRRTPADRPPGG